MTEQHDVLVTGGAGFIGANLCRSLIDGGDVRVRVLDDLSTGKLENLSGLDVDFIEGSILDRDVLRTAMPPGGSVVHLAALGSVPRSVADPVGSHDVNATGTLFVLEAARAADPRHFTLSSSSSVYGDNNAPMKHEMLPVAPRSPYGASKLAAESAALAYSRTFGLPVLAFRFFNVFGPLQPAGHAYAAVVPSFIDAALRGVPVTVHGDGGQSRDFTYVDTVCETLRLGLLGCVTNDGPVNLAFGSRVSLLEVIQLIAAEVGVDVQRNHVDPRPGDIRHSKADPSLLFQLFPDSVPTGIAAGIEQTVQWFRSTGTYDF